MLSTKKSGVSTANGTSAPSNNVSSIYKRTEVIGRGKFGVVYKGYHIRTKQICAIKVLNLDTSEDEVEDVQKEIQFLSSLKQVPNITHYYGSYLYDTKLWIIMEYCAGGSLRTLLRPGKIDEKYIGVIMRELLVALLYIHKDNVIHRDIKAANVLITNDGRVKLCDFGVAAQLTQSNVRRQTMAGTPYWMAPEVIMEGVYYDTKVDIWSLGITTYEITTGNPPYCDVEALRAMQLITKSKPPRLEGRQYSPLLKEFIALCLDEDPKERLAAEDLLKTRFIKTHKSSPTSILKELITRYLLHRDKNINRESVMANLEDDEQIKGTQNSSETSTDNSSPVETKWDFDSLSSSDYIIENDIDIDFVPEETDWERSNHDDFNFAYPDEEPYYQSNKPYYQGTTIGKTVINSTVNNYTIQAFTNNHTSATNYQSRNTFTTSGGGVNKKSGTKASKQLLQLFEDTDVISEGKDSNNEFPVLAKSVSTLHANNNSGNDTDLSQVNTNISIQPQRTYPDMLVGGGYQSQSTPALPTLQTSFSKPTVVGGPMSATTTIPTPVEIEIPEELPVSTMNLNAQEMHAQTKPRSSTVSAISNKAPPMVQRRPTISGGINNISRSENGSIVGNPKTIADEIMRSATVSGSNSKMRKRTPSPIRSMAPTGFSPNRKPPHSPTTSGVVNVQQVLPHTMKPMASINEKKDILLQPINTSDKDIPATGNNRVNREFKRNNPNLKLQMPSPTTLMPNKLLESNNASEENSNINQFGFNTSTSTIPVAMTPLGEKPNISSEIIKRKRSTSNSSRSNSLTLENLNNGGNSNMPPNSAAVTHMNPPPRSLPLDMFVDAHESMEDGDRVDRKAYVMKELDTLLKVFEEALPVMENGLRGILTNVEANEE